MIVGRLTNLKFQTMKKMKLFNLLMIVVVGASVSWLTSCHNGKREFPDFEGGKAVYFSYQYPIRTIVLGQDPVADNTLDNEHRFEIYATMGGAYRNPNRTTINFSVDESLTQKLHFPADSSEVIPMPQNYYTLEGQQIVLDKQMIGCVGVKLEDAFFEDPKALENTYVIPLVMNSVQGADYIKVGTRREGFETAPRTDVDAWDPEDMPRDYVLYLVKFINPWDATYLRGGDDTITYSDGTTTTEKRGGFVYVYENGDIVNIDGVDQVEYLVERDEVVSLKSEDLTTVILRVSGSDKGNPELVYCDLRLTFTGGLDGGNATCTITSATEGITASGTGTWEIDGAKKAWGNKDRNLLKLDYTIDYGDFQYATKDRLVFRSRPVKGEEFNPLYGDLPPKTGDEEGEEE